MSLDRLLAVVVRRLSWPLIRGHVTHRLSGVAGLEHLPAAGGVVVVPNHRSYYDHFVMLTLLRRLRPGQRIWFLTKAEAFTSAPSRIWHEAWDSIPVDRTGPTQSTVRAIRDRLAAGEVVCIYPEGTRNDGPGLLEFKDGAFRFADLADAPVVPVAMTGTEQVMPRGTGPLGALFGPGSIRVGFAPPLVATAAGRRARTEELRGATRAAVEQMIEHLDDGAFLERAAAGTAAAVDRAVTDGLNPSGRLPAEQTRRHARLLRIADDSGTRGIDLTVQRIRLRGLAAGNRRGLVRQMSLIPLGMPLRRLSRTAPDHFLAGYLLGRWQLSTPALLGGGPSRARRTFETAVRFAEPGDSRALSALAEACAALGDDAGTRSALLRVVETTPPGGRGAARIERARRGLARLDPGLPQPDSTPHISEGVA